MVSRLPTVRTAHLGVLLCLRKESDILDLHGEGSSSFKLKHVLLLCPVSCFSANRSASFQDYG